jgi:hypothetical protein
MSQLRSGPEPQWSEDIATAFAAARQVALERCLGVFLAAVSANTLRLIAYEFEGFGEALMQATICVRALLTRDPSVPSDEDVEKWSSRVQLFLILESLERRGFIHVDYGECSNDPLNAEPIIRVIGEWTF